MTFRTSPSAHDYLNFAQQDLDEGSSSRQLINALSNAKRSLHMRLEDLCIGFGAKDLKNLKNFPSLINFVRKCGLVAPRILERINKARNNVEHAFQIPTPDQVENFVDIVELFINATDRWRYRQPCDMNIYHVNEGTGIALYRASFDWPTGTCALYIGPPKTKKNNCQIHYIKSDDPKFYEWVTLLIKNDY